MAPLKVLISGAGIAGPSLAIWLARIGCDITVVEADSQLRTTGQQIDFRRESVPLMSKMGIKEAVMQNLCHEPGMLLRTPEGKDVGFFPAAQSGTGKQGPTSDYEVMRGDVVRILYEASKDLPGVKYVFGTRIKSFTQDERMSGGKVHVDFSDGTSGDYDLLAGADGIGSSTRKMMLGPDFPDPSFDLGVHIAFFTVPPADGDSKAWTVCNFPGGRMVSTRKDSPDNLRVYLSLRGDCKDIDAAERTRDLQVRKKAWADKFRDIKVGQAPRFIKALVESDLADDLYSQHMNQIRLPEGTWSRGRVVLLGDAAYCLTPYGGGLGNTAAMVGAYVIAGEIARKCKEGNGSIQSDGLSQAIQAYERTLRPYIVKNQQVPPVLLKAAYPKWRLSILIMQWVIWLVALVGTDWLAGWFSDEGSATFHLPEYPELDGPLTSTED